MWQTNNQFLKTQSQAMWWIIINSWKALDQEDLEHKRSWTLSKSYFDNKSLSITVFCIKWVTRLFLYIGQITHTFIRIEFTAD